MKIREQHLAKKIILRVGSILNAICLTFAFYYNTWNYCNEYKVNKWDLSPFYSIWEFFTYWWCVWGSILIFIYNFKEEKVNDNKKNEKQNNGRLGLVLALTNLTSIIGFTIHILAKIFSEKGKTKLASRSLIWWFYSFTWHYLVFPLGLYYFFKYSSVEEKEIDAKNLLGLVMPLPLLYFFANIIRSALANPPRDSVGRPFLGNGIDWFNNLQEGNYRILLAWIAFSTFYFWTMSYLLLKIKNGKSPFKALFYGRKKRNLLEIKKMQSELDPQTNLQKE